MPHYKILILEDDELWLARHERRLKACGFEWRSTQRALEAITIAKTDPSIKFALIDEILYVPTAKEDDLKELQRYQGSAVVKQIAKYRSDIQTIIVTSAPELRSKDNTRVFRRETAKLRRQRGVVDVIHKQDIEDAPDEAYGWLIDLLKRPSTGERVEIVKPRLLVGLEVPADILNGAKYKELRTLLLELGAGEANLPDSVDGFLIGWEKSSNLGKTIFIEMPGSKRLAPCPNIKSDSQNLKILEILACRAAKKEEVTISRQDYLFSPRKSGKKGDPPPEYDSREVKDFAYQVGDDGRKRLREGVQFEGQPKRSDPFKLQMNRLKDLLFSLNMGDRKDLFKVEQGCYYPLFEIDIILHSPNLYPAKKRGRK